MKTHISAVFAAWALASATAATIEPSTVSKDVLAECGSPSQRTGVPATYSLGAENLLFTNIGTPLYGGPIGDYGVRTDPDGYIRYGGDLDQYEVVLGNNPTQSNATGAVLSGYFPNLTFTRMLSFDGQQAPGLPAGTVFLPGGALTYDPTAGGPIYGELATHNMWVQNANGDSAVALMLHGPAIDEWPDGSLQPLGNGATLWRYENNQLHLLIRSGSQALGFSTRHVIAASGLQPRVLGPDGTCLYQADLGTAADITTRIPAIYLHRSSSGTTELVLYNGMPAPGIANATLAFSRGTRLALLDDGSVVIITYLEGEGLIPDNAQVLLRYANSALTIMGRTGEPVPGRPDLTSNLFEFYANPTAAFDLSPGASAKVRVRVGDYSTVFEDQLLQIEGDGAITTSDYYDVRGQAPGFPAGVTLTKPLRNDPQEARIVMGDVTEASTGYRARGCWFTGADGLKLIAYTGQTAPGIPDATIAEILFTKFEAKGPHERRAIILAQISGASYDASACAVFIAEDDGQLLLARKELRYGVTPAAASGAFYTRVSTSEDRAAIIQFKSEVWHSPAFVYLNPAGDTYTLATSSFRFDGLSDTHTAAILNESDHMAKGDYKVVNPRSGVVETLSYGGEQLIYYQFPGAAGRALLPLAASQLPTTPTPTPSPTPTVTPDPTPTPDVEVVAHTNFPSEVRARQTRRMLLIPLRASNASGIGTVRVTLKGRGMATIKKTWNAGNAVSFSAQWKVRIRDSRKAGSVLSTALRRGLRLELRTHDATRSYTVRMR